PIADRRGTGLPGTLRARAGEYTALDCRHLGSGVLRRRNALRRRDQLGVARGDRGLALDAARSRAGARRAARRPALRRSVEAHVDPADHYAAVRDCAGTRRALRTHWTRNRLARHRLRHSALALDLWAARRSARATHHVHAG